MVIMHHVCLEYIQSVPSVRSVFPLPADPASGKSISSKHLCLGVDPTRKKMKSL